jgi:DNA-binding NtrC family response regulator
MWRKGCFAALNALGSSLGVVDVTRKRITLRQAVAKLERDMIAATLKDTAGKVAPAARLLDVPLSTMWTKISKYDINPRYFNPEEI